MDSIPCFDYMAVLIINEHIYKSNLWSVIQVPDPKAISSATKEYSLITVSQQLFHSMRYVPQNWNDALIF